MTQPVGMGGHPPGIAVAPANPEAAKYAAMWEREEYRKVAPGEHHASQFLAAARPKPGSHVIDFGCGTGRGALLLAILGGVKVTMVDFVGNCLDEEIRQCLTTQAHALAFVKADLERPLPVAAQYGFCTDVMEHIPPDQVATVLRNILKAAQHCYFSIATAEDKCGALIGEPLHLTVRPFAWWLDAFRQLQAEVLWSQETDGTACFYVTAWASGEDVVKSGVLNEEEERICANVRANLARGFDQIHPHPTNELEVMILGGGPSLGAFEDEIKAKRAAGVKLVTLNGAYNWALDRGLTPSATVIVDARPFNARFVQPVVDGCRYFMASQVHPDVLAGLPMEKVPCGCGEAHTRTQLFHTMPNLIADILTEHYQGGAWHTIGGGSTVLLRTIPLLRTLGFTKFHLYGCDSCLMSADGVHHAYAQPENDGAPVLTVTTNTGGTVFSAHAWMISQAAEFITLIAKIGDIIDLAVYGDGLLAYILESGAQSVREEG